MDRKTSEISGKPKSMSENKCPRCGHQRHDPVGTEQMRTRHHDPMVESWYCGTYREPSGNLYESELCETRQELQFLKRLIREDDKVRREADQKSEEKYLMMRDSLDLLKDQLAHSKAELAKRERALEQAWGIAASDWIVKGESNDALCRALHGSGCPDLAEWLKKRLERALEQAWLKNRGKS